MLTFWLHGCQVSFDVGGSYFAHLLNLNVSNGSGLLN